MIVDGRADFAVGRYHHDWNTNLTRSKLVLQLNSAQTWNPLVEGEAAEFGPPRLADAADGTTSRLCPS